MQSEQFTYEIVNQIETKFNVETSALANAERYLIVIVCTEFTVLC